MLQANGNMPAVQSGNAQARIPHIEEASPPATRPAAIAYPASGPPAVPGPPSLLPDALTLLVALRHCWPRALVLALAAATLAVAVTCLVMPAKFTATAHLRFAAVDARLVFPEDKNQ